MDTKLDKCPLCHSDKLREQTETFLFGIFKEKFIKCENCLAIFRFKRFDLRLASTNDKENDVWHEYGNKTLTVREWNTIEKGGLSDVDQKQDDILDFFNGLRNGKISLKFIKAPIPVILKKNEEIYCVIPNITLRESRAIRITHGGYAGPRVRVAKGVSFSLGRFGSSSESHQEMRTIDKGVLTLTNQRVVFSGGFKTISVLLDKIISIDPFLDGISLHKEGREKTQYFLWSKDIEDVTILAENRSYSEPFSGLMFQFLVEGFRKH